MHDEECAIGLSVSNNRNQRWTAYGDKRLLDVENSDNLKYCFQALEQSAREVFDAWDTKKAPDKYVALDIIPTRKSIEATTQRLAPLFRMQDGKLQHRKNLADRGEWVFEDLPELSVSAFALRCTNSNLFKHPIKWSP